MKLQPLFVCLKEEKCWRGRGCLIGKPRERTGRAGACAIRTAHSRLHADSPGRLREAVQVQEGSQAGPWDTWAKAHGAHGLPPNQTRRCCLPPFLLFFWNKITLIGKFSDGTNNYFFLNCLIISHPPGDPSLLNAIMCNPYHQRHGPVSPQFNRLHQEIHVDAPLRSNPQTPFECFQLSQPRPLQQNNAVQTRVTVGSVSFCLLQSGIVSKTFPVFCNPDTFEDFRASYVVECPSGWACLCATTLLNERLLSGGQGARWWAVVRQQSTREIEIGLLLTGPGEAHAAWHTSRGTLGGQGRVQTEREAEPGEPTFLRVQGWSTVGSPS